MDRLERNVFLERLVAMRDGYRADADEQRAVLTVADAILYAEAVMAAAEIEVEPGIADFDGSYAYGPIVDAPAGTTQGTPPTRPRPEGWPWPRRRSRSSGGPAEFDGV